MKFSRFPLSLRSILLGGVVIAITACGESPDMARTQPANPPAFTPAELADSGSQMAQLGYQLALLERELTEDEFNQIEQQEVVSILQNMESAASSLMAEDAGESHLFLQEDMTAFVDTLREARLAAAMSPPRYYLAGKVTGGCVNCHQLNL